MIIKRPKTPPIAANSHTGVSRPDFELRCSNVSAVVFFTVVIDDDDCIVVIIVVGVVFAVVFVVDVVVVLDVVGIGVGVGVGNSAGQERFEAGSQKQLNRDIAQFGEFAMSKQLPPENSFN